MAELIDDKKVFSLLEVAQSIQKTLAERYSSVFWVKAEMNKLNHYSHSGHCYPELVEKRDGRVIALLKANLWKTDYLRINNLFLSILHEPLKDGIGILFSATINFDPTHGLSLRIIDIDPAFSLGELEREKQETIYKLTNEGVFHANKKLALAVLPQRIAVISVETSKGYSDYLKVINQNPWRYKFFNFLFPAVLQGERSVGSIMDQFDQIRKVRHHFDAVAIIRGGGGDVGLSSYNNYYLARAIALFPIPVFTGIGHSTNETVSEMVSYQNAITPTELADFLIQKFHNFAQPVLEAERIIVDDSQRLLEVEQRKFMHVVKYLKSATTNQVMRRHHQIKSLSQGVATQSTFMLKQAKNSVSNQVNGLKKNSAALISGQQRNIVENENNVRALDPINILKRGFSMTLLNGKTVQDISQVATGDSITTVLANGKIISRVNETKEQES
jgi:exodeoxyribonuclease VII large subunit